MTDLNPHLVAALGRWEAEDVRLRFAVTAARVELDRAANVPLNRIKGRRLREVTRLAVALQEATAALEAHRASRPAPAFIGT